MDLIYTSKFREEQGVLFGYELDLAFGADENDFECTVTAENHVCENGSLLFFEGTEYGGMVDSIESNTATDDVIYSGRTWHGILNSKVLEPDSGKDYLVLSGEANAVLASLVQRMGLTDLFSASDENSGITISNYKMNRYILGYDGIMKMLASAGGKLKITFTNGIAVLSALPIKDYTKDEEFDSDLVPFTAKRNYKSVNHLVCLGSGELAGRLVVHLYADEQGNVSNTQTFTGLDEITSIYEYSQISEEAELIAEGKAKFKELLAADEITIDFDADSDEYDVGDIIGAVDNVTGLSANATIKKKVLVIKNGQVSISLEPDTAKSGSTQESVGGGSGGSTGESGATFTPSVDADGNLSWTNDRGLENPETVNIKGEQGEKGDAPIKGTDYWTAKEQSEIISEVISGIEDNAGRLLFTDVSVSPAVFISENTYVDFPYRGTIKLSGVTADMTPEIVFGVNEAVSGVFAPVVEAYNGGVYIYASAMPNATFTVPTIVCWKESWYTGGTDSGGGSIGDFGIDETLSFENGILSVNTTNEVETGNLLPVTSAGVDLVVGNINVLLETI